MSDPLQSYLHHHGLSLNHCPGDPRKFRAIYARRRFPRGSIIITSQPLAAIPLPQSRTLLCNRCFKQGRLQRCSRCREAHFCSKECFAQAWKEWHKYTCGTGSAKQPGTKFKVNPPADGDDDDDDDDEDMESNDALTADGALDEEMLTRVAVTIAVHSANLSPSTTNLKGMIQAADPSSETPVVTLEAFSTLMSHAEFHPPSVIARYKSLARRVILDPCLGAVPGCELSMLDLTTYLCRFRCNNFSVHDVQLFPIGEGTYPVGSLFNHSCRPNAVVSYEGATQIVRCVEDVEFGEEIVIGYVDPAEAGKARRQRLKDKYFFTCTCERCRDCNSGLALVDKLLGEQQPEWERAQELLGAAPSSMRLWIEAEVARWELDGTVSMLTPHEIFSSGIPLSVSTFTTLVHETLVPSAYRTPIGEPTPASAYIQILIVLLAQLHTHPRPPSPTQDPTTLRMLATASRLFYDRITANMWGDAAKLGLYVMAVYLLVYPRYHPMVGLHALTLAKCLWNGVASADANAVKTQIRRCEKWVGMAREMIRVGFGGTGSVAKEVEELAEVIGKDGRA